MSIPAGPEDLDREEIAGAGEVALTRLSEGREGRDILVPPIAGTELGTENVCSTGRRLTVQRRREREPSAGSNIKTSWKSVRLRRCGGIKASGAGGRLAGGWTVRKRTSGGRVVDSDWEDR